MGEVLAQAWARGSSGELGEQPKPFLVPAKLAQRVLDAAASPASTDAMDLDAPPSPRARAKQLERQLVDEWRTVSTSSDSASPASLLPHAMVRVKLTPCMRGVPQDLGLVYELDVETAKEVRAKVDRTLEGQGKEAKATGEYDGAEDVRNLLFHNLPACKAHVHSPPTALRPPFAGAGHWPHHDGQLRPVKRSRRWLRRPFPLPPTLHVLARVRSGLLRIFRFA